MRRVCVTENQKWLGKQGGRGFLFRGGRPPERTIVCPLPTIATGPIQERCALSLGSSASFGPLLTHLKKTTPKRAILFNTETVPAC